MPIPIENIYYLLSYAWNKLEEAGRAAVSLEDETNLLDLFGKVLINAARVLLKKGIDKNYIPETAEIAGIKGKLELSETLKQGLLIRQRTVCSFDEFSADVLTNQILLAILRRLLKIKNLDASIKHEIKRLVPMFGDIAPIKIKAAHFKQIRLHRNNHFYGFVLNVCQLIYENTLPAETAGDWEFADFTRDERRMNQLFEAFVRNFYRLETGFAVRGEIIEWQFENGEDNKFLPQMRTDITLERGERKIIVDAKFYRETMSSRFDREKIHSANLYQIFSYLLNQRDGTRKTENAVGILLYPTIEKDFDLAFRYQTHDIFIKTVNLADNWKNISRRLKEIVGSPA